MSRIGPNVPSWGAFGHFAQPNLVVRHGQTTGATCERHGKVEGASEGRNRDAMFACARTHTHSAPHEIGGGSINDRGMFPSIAGRMNSEGHILCTSKMCQDTHNKIGFLEIWYQEALMTCVGRRLDRLGKGNFPKSAPPGVPVTTLRWPAGARAGAALLPSVPRVKPPFFSPSCARARTRGRASPHTRARERMQCVARASPSGASGSPALRDTLRPEDARKSFQRTGRPASCEDERPLGRSVDLLSLHNACKTTPHIEGLSELPQ